MGKVSDELDKQRKKLKAERKDREALAELVQVMLAPDPPLITHCLPDARGPTLQTPKTYLGSAPSVTQTTTRRTATCLWM